MVDMSITGANANAGLGDAAYDSELEAQHGVEIDGGSQIVLSSLTIADTYGDFVIVWNGAGPDDGSGVWAQRYSADGKRQAGQFRVNSFPNNYLQGAAFVAMDSNNNFLVVWQSKGEDGDGQGVYGQHFDAVGNAVGSEFSINSVTAGDQKNPSVAMDSAGDFVVCWTGNGPGDSDGVFARQFVVSPSGSLGAISNQSAHHEAHISLLEAVTSGPAKAYVAQAVSDSMALSEWKQQSQMVLEAPVTKELTTNRAVQAHDCARLNTMDMWKGTTGTVLDRLFAHHTGPGVLDKLGDLSRIALALDVEW